MKLLNKLLRCIKFMHSFKKKIYIYKEIDIYLCCTLCAAINCSYHTVGHVAMSLAKAT